MISKPCSGRQFRLKFEELFFLELNILHYIKGSSRLVGHVFGRVGAYFHDFYNNILQFPLTGAQKRVIREMRHDMGSGKQMNRLLQGDVGSGKTIVAFMTALIALDNGYQACIMAPTEILAGQHLDTIKPLADAIGVKVALLTGSTRKRERTMIHEALMSGELQILIGTHALIEDTVQFRNLGLAIIDEQHRFGVAQRARLLEQKPRRTAPCAGHDGHSNLPRTLAMTVMATRMCRSSTSCRQDASQSPQCCVTSPTGSRCTSLSDPSCDRGAKPTLYTPSSRKTRNSICMLRSRAMSR